MIPVNIANRIDRRRSHRVPLLHRVTYEVSVNRIRDGASTTLLEGQIQNVSEGGLCMVTEKALSHTQLVEIGLPLPVPQLATRTIVEVCWVRRESGQDSYTTGLRFLL